MILAAAIAGAVYLLAGLWTAFRWVDWRGKTFSLRYLPPVIPGERSWNALVGALAVGTLVALLWPVYRLAWNADRDPELPGGAAVGSDRNGDR